MARSDTPHSLAASSSTGHSPHFLALYQTFIEPHKLESFDAAANAVHLDVLPHHWLWFYLYNSHACINFTGLSGGVSDTLTLMLQICFFFPI
jgi:hypothetical protein